MKKESILNPVSLVGGASLLLKGGYDYVTMNPYYHGVTFLPDTRALGYPTPQADLEILAGGALLNVFSFAPESKFDANMRAFGYAASIALVGASAIAGNHGNPEASELLYRSAGYAQIFTMMTRAFNFLSLANKRAR